MKDILDDYTDDYTISFMLFLYSHCFRWF